MARINQSVPISFLCRLASRFALSIFLTSMVATDALADKRVALIFGVSNYQNVPQLTNPDNDAVAMSDVFKQVGFEVVELRRDLGVYEMRRAVREFAAIAADADMAIVYYAGHGIEVDGVNYLIPADAKLLSDFDVEDEAVSLDRILQAINPAKRLRLVILDACRDNPFSKTMKRSIATRAVGRGLAKIEPTTADTLIAFAAKAGAVASDGDGPHSPFSTALLRHIATPGLDLRIAFGRVRDEVLKSTDRRQEPFVYGSLGGETVALVPQVAPPVDPNAEARRDYEFAAQIGTKEAWNSFLAAHGSGIYANLAHAALDKLEAAEKASEKADAIKQQAEEQAKQKTEDFKKQLEEQAARQTEQAKKQMSEQAKHDLEQERQRIAEQAKRELDEAKRQLAEARKQADDAAAQVDQTKKQAAAQAQALVEAAKRDAEKAKLTAEQDGRDRRDYELAAQVGTKEAWNSFLAAHGSGIYANLARAALDKLDAAETASERADAIKRQAEEHANQKVEEYKRQIEEQAARETEQAKEQMSEDARLSLEKERQRIAEQAKGEIEEAKRQVAEARKQADDAANQVAQAKQQAVADAQHQIEAARREADRQAEQAVAQGSKVVALTAPGDRPPTQVVVPVTAPNMDPADIARLLQAHLKRVGCDPGAADGDWNAASQKALDGFNKYAGAKFDIGVASLDALDAVRARPQRICPLICSKGQKPVGDRCVQIVCESNFMLDSEGVCRKRPDPTEKPRITSRREPAASIGRGGGKCFSFNGKQYCE
jgi:uncharacterized caspase-like protein